jgi:translation initiation factor IF-1
MVKNTIGGKGHKRGKRGSKNPNIAVDVSSGIDHYAQVQKRLGGNRLQILLDDGQEGQATIPGKFMRKLWFNSGDFIHVRGEKYYEVVQKLIDPTEQQNAATALGKKLDDGEHNIFRPDVQEDDDADFDELPEQDENSDENSDEKSDEDEDEKKFTHDKMSVAEKKAQQARIVTKQSVCADKFQRKLNEKSRDLSRRANAERDFSQIPESIVKSDEQSESESEEGTSNENSDEINIDDI